jgi:hypothetical protein
MVALWVLAGTVGRPGKSSAIPTLFFLVTVMKTTCAAIFVVFDTDCVVHATSALIFGFNSEKTTLLTSALFAVLAS